MNRSAFWISVMITALLAGSLDLLGAILSFKASRGTFPVNIFKYIAGGVLKGKAMEGGVEMHLLGGFLHFFIAFIWSFIFYGIYPRLKFLHHQSIVVLIILWGIIIWSVMNLVVLPLSAWKAPIHFQNPREIAKAVLIIIICVAWPIVLRTKNYYKRFSMKQVIGEY